MKIHLATLIIVYAVLASAAAGLFGVSLSSLGLPALLIAAVLAWGIARPGSRLFYPTVTHGPRAGNHVAITFDDGPDSETTPHVLDVLAQYGAKATFFVIGRSLAAQPALAQRILAEGHELGNHSWRHSRWQNFFSQAAHRREMERATQAITDAGQTGTRPLYRPPLGLKSPPLARAAHQLGLTLVAWSLHSHDTRRTDPARIAQDVLRKVRAGDIILMHDGHDLPGHHRSSCAKALPMILQGLEKRGMVCVTVSELLQMRSCSEA
jgi:peptidoglycan/xylan/chitin deacetylase (PgdA/CDA1 family)